MNNNTNRTGKGLLTLINATDFKLVICFQFQFIYIYLPVCNYFWQLDLILNDKDQIFVVSQLLFKLLDIFLLFSDS